MILLRYIVLFLLLTSCSSLVTHDELKKPTKESHEVVSTPKVIYKEIIKYLTPSSDNSDAVNQEISSEVSSVKKNSQNEYEDFELDYKEKHFKFWVNYFTKKQKDRFLRHANNGMKYRNTIREILAHHELPQDLFYVGLIESGYNTYIKSRAAATGPWQFMKGSAGDYGLKVNSYVDERSNIVKSTHAAASYFKDLYNIFGSWELALCAYNAGPNRVIRAIKRGNTRDYKELVSKRLIPKETIYYIPKVAAAREIFDHPEKYNMKLPKVKEGLFDHVKPVTVRGSFDVYKLAKKYDVPYKLFKKLNPDLRKRWIRNRKLRVFVPTKELTHYASLMSEYQSRQLISNSSSSTNYYKVRRGDNLTSISKRTGVSLRDLRRLNRLSGSKIYIGQRLVIGNTSRSTSDTVYKVRRGDNLSRIAKKHGVTVGSIKLINELRSNKIFVGQRLKITQQAQYVSYNVRRGDNLIKLSRKFRVDLKKLKRVNNIKGSTLYVGQSLKIPSNG